ncbi:MAG: glycosyltransferase family 39 protein [bacterium]
MRRNQEATSTTPLAVEAGLLFLLLWSACLVFFPHWYAQAASSGANPVYSFAVIWIFIAVGIVLVYRLFRGEDEPFLKEPAFLYPALVKLWPILVLCLLAHLPFLNAPVETGLDAQEHAGVPAVIVALIRDRLPVPLALIAWPALIALLFMLRKYVLTRLSLRSLIVWGAVLFLLAALEAVALLHMNGIDLSNHSRFITRYPALGRFLFGIMYALFGIHEWGGRVTQLLLSAVAAIYIYRLGELFFTEMVGIAAALLLLFLPPMFHYGNMNMLDCGTVTLAVVSEFYLLRYFEESRRRDFCRALFLLSAGILYKRVLLFMAPIAVAQWAVHRLWIERRFSVREAMGFALPGGTFVVYQWFAQSNEDVPSAVDLSHFLHSSFLLGPIRELPTALTWPILILAAIGVILSVHHGGTARRWCLYGLVWYAVYLLCYIPWTRPANIRQALPSYPPLVLFAASAFEYLAANATRPLRRVLWCSLSGYLVWGVLLLPRPAPASDLLPIKDGTWMNLTNQETFYLPYSDMFRWIAEHVPQGAVIYAPMANEPSGFYLAAYGLRGRFTYLGDRWAPPGGQSIESLKQYCRSHNVSYLLLPNRRWAQNNLSRRFLDNVGGVEAEFLVLVCQSTWGTEHLSLYELAY